MGQVLVPISVMQHIWLVVVSNNIAPDPNQDGPRWIENPYKVNLYIWQENGLEFGNYTFAKSPN